MNYFEKIVELYGLLTHQWIVRNKLNFQSSMKISLQDENAEVLPRAPIDHLIQKFRSSPLGEQIKTN